MHSFLKIAIESVITAMGDRDDIEFIIADDSNGEIPESIIPKDSRINHFILPSGINYSLIMKMNLAINMAHGDYFCPADHDDLSHPDRFTITDELINSTGSAVVGADDCVFYDAKRKRCYRLKENFRRRIYTNPWTKQRYEYTWLQHSNSAILTDWLKHYGYDGGKSLGLVPTGSAKFLIDTPVWVRASIDKMRVSTFDMIDETAWARCWQILTGFNVNTYKDSRDALFDEIVIDVPKSIRNAL